MQVLDNDLVRKKIKKYQLEKQYQKALQYLQSGSFHTVQLKIRKPKQDQIYQFRINKKFRALAFKQDKKLYVFEISDHQ